MGKEKIQCEKCLLHTGIPGVEISQKNLCPQCESSNSLNTAILKKQKKINRIKMEEIFEKVKAGKHMFDALVMFSGGKDSSYLLDLAKNKYGLNVAAFSVIHPLVNEISCKNMENITRKLQVEHIRVSINEDVYRKFMHHGLLEGHKYGFAEFSGCTCCSFFYKWMALKLAVKLEIPLILEGSDAAQGGGIWRSEDFQRDFDNGINPCGKLHDLFEAVFGEEYRYSLYGYDRDEFVGKTFPTVVAPLGFLDYDYKEGLENLNKIGLVSKEYSPLITNCDAVHFFDSIMLKNYNCTSYVKAFSNELRNGDGFLGHMEVDTGKARPMTKEEMLEFLKGYEAAIHYAVENKICRESASEEDRKKISGLLSGTQDFFGEETIRIFTEKILSINNYADFFDIDLTKSWEL